MLIDPLPKSETRLMFERIEHILNVIAQILIGFVTLYMSWLCLKNGLAGTALHAWLCTLGFVFLMAEGVMCHYQANLLMFTYSRPTKTTIHWILQSVGGSLGVIGVLVKISQKGFKLKSTHSKLGFATFIICLISMLSGLSALYSMKLKKYFSPLWYKSFHNILGVTCFILAMFTQYYGYETGYFSRQVDAGFQTTMEVITIMALFLVAIGPFKALINKFQTLCRHY